MMTDQQTGQESFQELLVGLYGEIAEKDALQKVRGKAWDHFLELGLPTRKTEQFNYVRLRSLFSQKFEFPKVTEIDPKEIEKAILPECTQSCLVFVNGYFVPSLSRTDALPKRVVVTTLSDAMRTYSGFLNTQWSKSIKEETDAFAAINIALHCDGLFFYVPPKTIVEAPIQLLNVIDAKNSPMLVMPRFQSFIGNQSELSFVSTKTVLSGSKYAINMVSELSIEEESHVKYTQISCGASDDLWHFDAVRGSLKRNSTLKTIVVTDGAGTVRHDYRVVLNGENAEALLNGVWMLNGKKEAHMHVLMDHQAPNCRSMQLFKGALTDFSRSSFEGKILVRQAAQKTQAFQLNNNLLLSDRANADSKPNLEIFADDVKASHGSTVGQLDNEQIFYMKTRGFSDSAAKNLLIHGFCQEVIDMIQIPSVHKTMETLAQEFLLPENRLFA